MPIAPQRQRSQGHYTWDLGENKFVVSKGGKIAGDARGKLEIETGDKVVSRKTI